jgi:hypothetical protein
MHLRDYYLYLQPQRMDHSKSYYRRVRNLSILALSLTIESDSDMRFAGGYQTSRRQGGGMYDSVQDCAITHSTKGLLCHCGDALSHNFACYLHSTLKAQVQTFKHQL